MMHRATVLLILLGSIGVVNALDGNFTDDTMNQETEEKAIVFKKSMTTDRRNALRSYELASFICCPLCYLFNLVSIVVFIRMWRQSRTPVLLALIALCIADPLATIINADYLIWATTEWSPMQNTDAGCKTINWLATVAHDCSNALCLLIAIERFVAVFFPHKVDKLVTKVTTTVAIVTIFVVYAGLEGYRFVIFTHMSMWDTDFCSRDSDHLDLGRQMSIGVTESLGFLINWFGLTVCYALIIGRLFIWKQKSKQTGQAPFTLMLLCMSVFSLGCNIMRIVNAIILMESGTSYINNYDRYINSSILLLVGHSFNFVFYALMGKKFRQNLVQCCTESNEYDMHKESKVTEA
ncbi:hypothetical protein CAPTEDRAFT_206038 [Capitella teleta]|uniref:G-protein coupled receptors family 1 profile domain-containing protein n=1 Tax=Capitella teleta TaxID=283909 RepID=R7UZI5_CAPTE|nr:hypothetical protein CAPTEDRAFT_206038 [Capitella teleta]|eukprot:ELU08851.1 hypothetical protein CAPTEDRAFT_206038 [Capitella teleta]